MEIQTNEVAHTLDNITIFSVSFPNLDRDLKLY